jgi:hypothetical protein
MVDAPDEYLAEYWGTIDGDCHYKNVFVQLIVKSGKVSGMICRRLDAARLPAATRPLQFFTASPI